MGRGDARSGVTVEHCEKIREEIFDRSCAFITALPYHCVSCLKMANPVSLSASRGSLVTVKSRQPASSCAIRGNVTGLRFHQRLTRGHPSQKGLVVEARRASDPIIPPVILGRRPEDGADDMMTYL